MAPCRASCVLSIYFFFLAAVGLSFFECFLPPRDAIASLPVTVCHGAMDDAWRELWTEGLGSRTVRWYSRAQRQTTTEIWLPLQFCSFIIAHGSSPSLPETVCAEPIVCCVMIGRNPGHADRACAPLDAPRSNGNPRPSHHTRAPVAGLDLYALNA